MEPEIYFISSSLQHLQISKCQQRRQIQIKRRINAYISMNLSYYTAWEQEIFTNCDNNSENISTDLLYLMIMLRNNLHFAYSIALPWKMTELKQNGHFHPIFLQFFQRIFVELEFLASVQHFHVEKQKKRERGFNWSRLRDGKSNKNRRDTFLAKKN